MMLSEDSIMGILNKDRIVEPKNLPSSYRVLLPLQCPAYNVEISYIELVGTDGFQIIDPTSPAATPIFLIKYTARRADWTFGSQFSEYYTLLTDGSDCCGISGDALCAIREDVILPPLELVRSAIAKFGE